MCYSHNFYINDQEIKNLVIPESVTSIGDYAFFGCSKLTSVTIPESVTSIGDYAFYGCSSLTKTNYTGDIAGWCNIKFYSGSANPMYCSHNFYINDQEIKDLVIPNNVTSIGSYAFNGCSSLTSVTIGKSVTSIGSSAFDDCSSLTSVTINSNAIVSKDYSSDSNISHIFGSKVTEYIIGESVISIGDAAFNGCSSLTSVTIPNSVTSIGVYAFNGCSSLTSVTIPNSVTNIGYATFNGCSSLTSVTIGESVTSIGEWAFHYCSSLTSVTIPNSVTSIGVYAFYDCSSLTSVTIGKSVTSIGSFAFEDCSSLTSVTINSDAIVSKDYSYDSNISPIFGSQVTEYIIGESVTSIGTNAFSRCSKLTSVTIGESVTSIGSSAFYYCSSLTKTNYTGDITGWCNIKFGDGSANPMHCSHNFYINDQEIKNLVIPESVTSIGDYAFFGCSKLTSVTIPESVTSIGDYAFYGCSSLTKTNYIGDIAGWCNIKFGSGSANPMYCSHNFYINDQEIKDLVIPNSVTSIGNWAFYGCSSLTSVTIPNSVTSIGDAAFNGCSSLTSVTIPNSVTSIGESAFYHCTSLTSITCEATIPPTVGANAFYDVSKSIPVYVPCGCVKAYKAASGWKDFTNIQEPLAEYSIEVNVNDNIMGSAKVDKNTACVNQISATANYGYHFVQWSDGNTDNPRTLVLTQDTVLTAEFAINQYTVTTRPSHNERGTTQGDTTVNHLENVTISATANYGYHFTQWNDGNTSNPRQVQVTKDKTYTAYFDKNTYAISLSCNEEQGSVEGVTSAEYLDTVTISATPNIGYHFVQWSDGVTDNPRTLELTQDTTFSAEFAQSFSGQCGDNLYWSHDETAKTISITGSGKMYDYTATTQPWLLFKEQIVEVTTTNTVTSIGTSAFEGCARLAKISLGTGLEEIAANAFAGCTRLYDIYVYATYPPFAEKSSFANYNVYVYIPCEYQRDYILDVVWGEFKFIECIDSEEATTDGNVTIVPGFNDVTITWPTETGADSYTIVIKKGDTVFCTLTFSADGQLLNIAFAPGRDGNHPAQYAEQAGNGYRFTVTGLEEGTQYAYNITTKDAANNTIATYSGEFTTMGGTTTDMDNIQSPMSNCQKILYEDHIYILRDGKTYTIMGQEI